jgi:hypothetical protein
MVSSELSSNLLAIYLNDHLAGATGGLELVKRAAGSNEGTELGAFLDHLRAEIQEDRESLIEVMDRLEVSRDRMKVTGGWLAEKAGRLKLNGQLLGYSPLSRVVELEGLHLGINGKLSCWQSLRQANASELAGFDLDRLIQRAEHQLVELEPHRREAAAEAFTDSVRA